MWLLFSSLAFSHHPPTTWVAVPIGIYPCLICENSCSCTRTRWLDRLLSCLSGCFLGGLEAIILRVRPNPGTAMLIALPFNAVATVRNQEILCRWREVRAIFFRFLDGELLDQPLIVSAAFA